MREGEALRDGAACGAQAYDRRRAAMRVPTTLRAPSTKTRSLRGCRPRMAVRMP